MLSNAIMPCANLPEPDPCLQDLDEGNPDEGIRPNQKCTKNRMVVVDYSPRRHTMKVVNHEELKYFLDYVRIHCSRVVKVGEKLNVILLQGSMRQAYFLLMEKEYSIAHWKENTMAMERVVQLLNRKRDIVYEVWRN